MVQVERSVVWVVKGRYGNSGVTGSTSLTGGQLHNIIFRHRSKVIYFQSVADFRKEGRDCWEFLRFYTIVQVVMSVVWVEFK